MPSKQLPSLRPCFSKPTPPDPIAPTKSCSHHAKRQVSRSRKIVVEALERHYQPFYPSGICVDSDAVRPRQRDERYSCLFGDAQRHCRRRRDRDKNGKSDHRVPWHHVEAAAAGNHCDLGFWLVLTMLAA